jgi:hypothetical protein
MDGPVVQATSRLYAVLSVTGGKVGAASLWRKSVDEILSIGWASLHALRTTFPNDGMISYPAFKPCIETNFSQYGPSQTSAAKLGRRDSDRAVES